MAVNIQLRRGTAAEWTAANPTLAEGEMGIETDTDLFKIGDGATAWNSLGYGGLQGTDGDPGIVVSDTEPSTTNAIWLDTDDPLEPLVVPGGGTTGQVLSKASGDDYDTQWSTVDLSTKQDDVITTQGDLVIGDVSGNPVRLPVGTADQVLTSDGTTVSFQDAAGGGVPGFTKIADVTLSGSSTTVTGISGYKNYQIRLNNVSNGNDGITTLLSGWNGDNTGHKVLLGVATNASGITLDEIGNSGFFNVFRQIENSGAGNGLVSIFNADNNGYANVFVQGAPESNTNGSRGSIGQALILKNSQPLNSFVVECNGGAFDEGTVEVWAQ